MNTYIGFACTTIFHYLHFKRIASYVKEEAIFIIATPKYTNSRYEKLEQYFNRNRIHFCSSNDIISGEVMLNAIVAPYYLPLFNFIEPEIFRIRVLYGYAKDAWNYADWNKGFDLILAYGPYSQRKLEIFAPTISIGHPRYLGETASQFREVYSINEVPISQWFVPGEATLLYCPTWGDLSSFNWFKQAVDDLKERYKLIIKLHHGIALSNEFELNQLDNDKLFICDETADLFDLFPYSDLVISDYSGAIFDAMLPDKKIVLVNSLPVQVTDTGVLNINKMSSVANLHLENINQSGSLDMQVREFLPNTDSPMELYKIVAEELSKPANDYKTIKADLYSYIDHQAPMRAGQVINELLSNTSIPARKLDVDYIAFDKEALLHFIEDNKGFSFIIWGAGDFGQLIISHLVNHNYSVKGVLDSSIEKQNQHLYGIGIVSPNDYELKIDERLIISFKTADVTKIVQVLSNRTLEADQFVVPFH